MARPPTKIYLAGPLAFSELGQASQTELVRLLTNAGYEAVDSFALAPADEIERINRLASLDSQRDDWRALNVRIGQPTPARSMTATRWWRCSTARTSTAEQRPKSVTHARAGNQSSAIVAIFVLAPTTSDRRSICRSSTSSPPAAAESSSRPRQSTRRSLRRSAIAAAEDALNATAFAVHETRFSPKFGRRALAGQKMNTHLMSSRNF